jgi:hypothetical protein
MGIKSISQFIKIIPRYFKQKYKKVSQPDDHLTFSGLVTEILIMYDPEEYFNKAWRKSHWDILANHSHRVFEEFGVDVKRPRGIEIQD